MSFQAYLDNIKAKTGKTPEDFRELAAQKGLVKSGEIVAWLKQEFGLGHGHASAIAGLLVQGEKFKASPPDKVAMLFSGNKAALRPIYDLLAREIGEFGADISLSPNLTYVNVQRGGKKFAILQPSSAERLDVGIKLKIAAPTDRFEASGSWNAMVSHRVGLASVNEVDAELLDWLRRAYAAV